MLNTGEYKLQRFMMRLLWCSSGREVSGGEVEVGNDDTSEEEQVLSTSLG